MVNYNFNWLQLIIDIFAMQMISNFIKYQLIGPPPSTDSDVHTLIFITSQNLLLTVWYEPQVFVSEQMSFGRNLLYKNYS